MKTNGFIITKFPRQVKGVLYCGIDTEVWPCFDNLIEKSELSIVRKFDKIDDVLSNFSDTQLIDEHLKDYYKHFCEFKCRALYAEIWSSENGFNNAWHDKYAKKENFLGFDVGFAYGDFYSAVLNDIIFRTLEFEINFKEKLNKFQKTVHNKCFLW